MQIDSENNDDVDVPYLFMYLFMYLFIYYNLYFIEYNYSICICFFSPSG